MRKNYLLLTLLTVTVISSAAIPSPVTKAATTSTISIENNISPRYSYVTSFDMGVYPDSSEIKYDMKIRGTKLTSFSGTVTLYKESSPNSGTYTEIKSQKLSIKASNSQIVHKGSTTSRGSGKYKLTYSGRVYSENGSEYISGSHYNSY